MGIDVDIGANREQQRKNYNDTDDAGQSRSDRSEFLQSRPIDDEIGDEPTQNTEDGR